MSKKLIKSFNLDIKSMCIKLDNSLYIQINVKVL